MSTQELCLGYQLASVLCFVGFADVFDSVGRLWWIMAADEIPPKLLRPFKLYNA